MDCKEKTGKEYCITLTFPTETIYDWYPLNVNHEYRYDEGTGVLFLAPLDYNQPKRYGITKRRRMRAQKGEPASVDIKSFNYYMEEVKKENEKIMAEAEKLGINTSRYAFIRREITPEAIEAHHLELTHAKENVVKDRITDRAYASMEEKEWERYLKGSEEVKDEILYTFAEEDEIAELYMAGCIRVLLNLLRKGASAYELPRLSRP